LSKDKLSNKLKQAAQFHSEGKNLHAVQVLKSLIEEFNSEEIYFQLAELYEDMGFILSGKNALVELIHVNPGNQKIKLYYGQYLLRNAMWFEAIEILNTVSDTAFSAHFLIGYAYMMINELELSGECFRKYLSGNDNSELKQEANIYLAKIEYELQHFDEALRYAKDAEYLYADFWELNLIFAKIYYTLGMHTHAAAPIKKALKHNSKEPAVLEFAGRIYFKLEEYKKAEQYFTEFIDRSMEVSAEIYTLLARSFIKQRKIEEANLFVELALQSDPHYLPAKDCKKELIIG
jgi:tetratricopeptide (TPR) repeat protein